MPPLIYSLIIRVNFALPVCILNKITLYWIGKCIYFIKYSTFI